MKPLPINWSKFKKVSGDKESTTMRHEDGHEMRIAHKALSPKMRGDLAKLPSMEPQKMAMGGEVLKKENYDGGGLVTGNKSDDDEQERRRKAAGPDVGSQTKKGHTADVQPKDTTTLGQVIGYADGGQVDDDSKKKTLGSIIGYPGFAEGGQAQPDLPPEQLAARDQKRSAYNRELAMSQQMNPNTGEPMDTPIESMFSKVQSDPLPTTIDPKAWLAASNTVDNANQMSAESAAAQAQSATTNAIQENQARQAAGLPLVPVPGQMPAGAAPSSQPTLDAAMQAPPPAATPASTDAASKALGTPSSQDVLGQAYNDQLHGTNALAKAEADLGKKRADALQSQMDYTKKAVADYDANVHGLNNELDAAWHDVQNKHIDPQAFWNNKNTAGKVSTMIGLVLGGLAGGLTGKGGNQALDFMNKQIDHDIDAQKAELGKSENLLSYNMKKFGNLNAATEMTRAMQMSMTANQLDQAAATAQGPEAKARAQMMSGEIKAKFYPIIQKNAIMMTLSKLKAEVGNDPSKANMYFDTLAKVDPAAAKDQRERFVPGFGWANNEKDATELKDTKSALDQTKSIVTRLLQINDTPGKAFSPDMRAEAESLRLQLIGSVRTPLFGNRFNETELHLLEGIARSPTAVLNLDSATRKSLTTLVGSMDQKFNFALKAHGLNVPSKESQLSPQQQSYAKWAKANPKDPRAQAVLSKLGMTE